MKNGKLGNLLEMSLKHIPHLLNFFFFYVTFLKFHNFIFFCKCDSNTVSFSMVLSLKNFLQLTSFKIWLFFCYPYGSFVNFVLLSILQVPQLTICHLVFCTGLRLLTNTLKRMWMNCHLMLVKSSESLSMTIQRSRYDNFF